LFFALRKNAALAKEAHQLGQEDVIQSKARSRIARREMQNPRMATGDISWFRKN